MTAQRKPFRREGEDIRRRELVEATFQCIAAQGMERTTVREIAIKAGVTSGLIRHYFSSKEELVLAAYTQYVGRMVDQSRQVVASAGASPLVRLATFVRTNLSPPVVDQTNLFLWAGFIEAVRMNPAMAAVHREGYQGYRNDAEELIRAALLNAKRLASPSEIRRLGISLNAIIDGLWLEGSLSPDEFASGELAAIGLEATSALLRLDLTQAENS